MTTMKLALRAVGLMLVAGAAVGCGGGGNSPDEASAPPDNASTQDFCKNYQDFSKALMELGQDAEDAEFVKALKTAGAKFEETGTPEDATEGERAGYEVFIQLIEDVEDDASQKDLAQLEKDLSKEQQEQLDAFTAYVSETCQQPS